MRKVVTIPVPESLKKDMEGFKEVNWAEVGRQAFRERVEDLKLLKEIKDKRGLTEKDALEIGKAISKSMAKNMRFKN